MFCTTPEISSGFAGFVQAEAGRPSLAAGEAIQKSGRVVAASFLPLGCGEPPGVKRFTSASVRGTYSVLSAAIRPDSSVAGCLVGPVEQDQVLISKHPGKEAVVGRYPGFVFRRCEQGRADPPVEDRLHGRKRRVEVLER